MLFFSLLLLVLPVNAQFYGQGFFSSSIDEREFPIPIDERFRQQSERLSAQCDQRIAPLKDRLDRLEKKVSEMHRATTYDWTLTDSGTLYKIFPTKKSWSEAQSTCGSFDSQLAVIDSDLKNAYIKSLVSKQYPVNETSSDDEKMELWIGLKAKTEMSSPTSRYSNFYDDEKVDGCTTFDHSGKWQIRPCQTQLGFICQQINVR